ncbi:hypothetical protein AB1Y20_013163 [Prymnesium parvum]|uniref:Methyltransferase domain-containing protein n=1 Tax=Prymnesium parvum TaxID=97485 RepID=A0AB34IMV5_PRYPA
MLELGPDDAAAALRRLNYAEEPLRRAGVYAPCHGTALLLAAIAAEAEALRAASPAICLDLGCGSGVVAALLAALLPQSHVIASDILPPAPRAALETAARNGARVAPLCADLLRAFRPRSIDCAAFHVPYVPTSDEILTNAAARADFSATWAGGPRGRGVLLRLLPTLRAALSPSATLYLLFYEADELVDLAAAHGLRAVPIGRFHSSVETLFVLRCTLAAPRVLVLDCGSVTNADATADLAALAAAMRVDVDAARRGMAAAWAAARAAPSDAAAYWRTALHVAGAAAPADDEAVRRCEAAVHATLRRTHDATLATARHLKARGALVGVLSNHVVSPPWFQACDAAAGLYELASHPSLVVVSQEVRAAKPEPRIYEVFLERLRAVAPGVQPAELLFVDDKEKNVRAARQMGWNALCFDATHAAPGALAAALGRMGLE